MNISDLFPPQPISLPALFEEIRKLHERIGSLEEEVVRLRAENEELKRARHVSSPFSKGTMKAKRNRSGRTAGEGEFRNRPAPKEDEITYREEVKVEETECPECGGELVADGEEVVTVAEIAEMPKPEVKEFRMEVCRCGQCGKKVRARHPEVAEDQRGATAHRVGERAYAMAAMLHYEVGVPMKKLRKVLKRLLGLDVTQGAISQALKRLLARAVGPAYAKLRSGIRNAEWTHTDDTGWRIGGKSAHLMVFETASATVYQIRPRHRSEEVQELIPCDYAGTLVTDRARQYDVPAYSKVKKHKCLSHLLKNIKTMLEHRRGRGRSFGVRLKALLQEANELWKANRAKPVADFGKRAAAIKARVTEHLKPRNLSHPDDRRMLKELGRQHEQGNLLRFLEDPSIEPTNNRAERALRPAVIARKISQCSRNETGARCFEAFKSVTQTLARQGRDVVAGLLDLFHGRDPFAASP
jgi:transposase